MMQMGTTSERRRDGLDPRSDAAVVSSVLAGERSAYEILMRRHNAMVYRVVRSVLRDDGQAEDVMQHAYLSAFEHLAQFRSEARFSTWLTRIAVYEALRTKRKAARWVPLADEDLPGEKSWDWSHPEAQAAATELRPVLEAAVESLADGYRTVFVLREVEGMTTAEVAETMGLTEDNVKVRLHRAKAALQKRVREDLGEAGLHLWRFEATRCDRVVARVLEALGTWAVLEGRA